MDCVRSEGKCVLEDPRVQRFYGLDDEREPKLFAGERVQVTRTIDRPAKVIRAPYIHFAQ